MTALDLLFLLGIASALLSVRWKDPKKQKMIAEAEANFLLEDADPQFAREVWQKPEPRKGTMLDRIRKLPAAVAFISTTSAVVLGGTGGRPGGGGSPSSNYSAPNTPSVTATVISDPADSLRLIGSNFSGSLDDTHDSTHFQVDTLGGDWTSPQYWDQRLGAVTTDTVPAVDSAAVVQSRMRFRGTNGGWSAWSDSVQTTMVFSGNPNEPANFTEATSNPMDSKAPTGWTDFSGENFTIETDGTAPISPSNVGRATYPAGFTGGSAPINVRYMNLENQQIYIHFALLVSSNWDGHSSGTGKLFFIGNDSHDDIFLNVFGSGNGSLQMSLQTQNVAGGTGSARYDSNQASASITRGTWYEFEVHITLDSTPAAEDGSFKIWKDGALTHDYSDVSLTRTGDDNTLDYLAWEPTYGGGSSDSVGAEDQWMDVDHIYISEGP